MDYCFSGHSGLEVSTLGLGAIFCGTGIDEKTALKIAERYYEAGRYFIDISNLYGGGMRGRKINQVQQGSDSKNQSIEKRSRNTRLKTEFRDQSCGKNWQGHRSRFILSGFLTGGYRDYGKMTNY